MTFEEWWNLEGYRRKYPKESPACLAGKEAFNAGLQEGERRERERWPKSDDYVAWLRYVQAGEQTRIVICSSDQDGAFKVYRIRAYHPSPRLPGRR